MRRLGGAAIPMQSIFNNIKYIIGDQKILEQMKTVKALPIFSDEILYFLDCISKKLLYDDEAKKYPDVIAYAFWIRKASLEKASIQYKTKRQKIGKGVAFQIAPANIPVQFAISMTYALIAGNASIIRISEKNFEQTDIICGAIRSVLCDICPEMAAYICIIRYDHDHDITQALSDICDIRMIWGGDRTITTIRKATVKPRCIDLGFADRYSIAVIDSDDYLKKDIDQIANDFYNDTYFSDQNACSSPRLVIWTGNEISRAKELFWDALADIVSKKYTMDPICSSEKLLKTALCAAKYPGIREIKKDNLLVRIELPSLYDGIMDLKGNCGYFLECSLDNLQHIEPLMTKGCQTITYVGKVEEQIRRIINDHGVRGVDRIVPVGHAADISFVWDGLDLPNVLSRQISDT